MRGLQDNKDFSKASARLMQDERCELYVAEGRKSVNAFVYKKSHAVHGFFRSVSGSRSHFHFAQYAVSMYAYIPSFSEKVRTILNCSSVRPGGTGIPEGGEVR